MFGLLSVDRKSWIKRLVQGTSYEIRDLNPGSDYGVSIQSVLGSDTSQEVHREFSTRKRHLSTHTCRIGLNDKKIKMVLQLLLKILQWRYESEFVFCWGLYQSSMFPYIWRKSFV